VVSGVVVEQSTGAEGRAREEKDKGLELGGGCHNNASGVGYLTANKCFGVRVE
jgi:hypothetical protein